jgi:hypothetical protein
MSPSANKDVALFAQIRFDAMTKKEPSKLHPRVLFDYDKIAPVPAHEPPLPSSDAARNHVPNPYANSALTHEKIAAIRAKATNASKDLNIDYAQESNLYPDSFPHFVRGRDSLREYIASLFTSQIAIYDGAMGTMIQNYAKRNRLEEEEYRGERFKDWSCNVKGNNDMLSISQPQIILGIYRAYLEEGGSNLIGTNTFSSTTIAMADYDMEDYAYELNYEGARLARQVCDEVTAKDPTKPRFVVGAIGPTNRTASISPSVEDASARKAKTELVKLCLCLRCAPLLFQSHGEGPLEARAARTKAISSANKTTLSSEKDLSDDNSNRDEKQKARRRYKHVKPKKRCKG